MGRRMETDDSIVVMGEDVHRLNGGTNGATKGLTDRFPGRVLGTPISENAFAGLGGGMALDGRFRPVVEFMYADFMWVAADQLFNQIGKARHMFGGDGAVPLVLRTKVAIGSGYGSQHSMDPAGIFATTPGWRIVAPSTPFDYVGLMNSALALQDPVLVIEHVDLYASTGDGPVDDFDYCLPVGKAAVRRDGVGDHGDRLPRDGPNTCSTRSNRPDTSTPRSSTCAGSTARASTGRRSARASARPTTSSSPSRALWARPTAAGSPTRSSGATSTGSTSRCSG